MPPPPAPLSPPQQVAQLERKLAHLRAWVASVNAQVAASNPQLVKNARKLYVGGVPEGTTEEELFAFFTGLVASAGAAAAPGNAVVSCKITPEKGYAFLELRTAEEASNAMAFDGVQFKDANLKVRRPSNYDAAAALLLGPPAPDPTVDVRHVKVCRTVVEDSWQKVFVGGLPSDWTDDQVKELLAPYGALKSFNLVMDKATGKSKGYCFCEFDDDAAIEGVIAGLHMKNLNRKLLTVKRALDGLPPNRSYSTGSEGGGAGGGGGGGSGMGSRRGSGLLAAGGGSGAFARSGSGGAGGAPAPAFYGPPPPGAPGAMLPPGAPYPPLGLPPGAGPHPHGAPHPHGPPLPGNGLPPGPQGAWRAGAGAAGLAPLPPGAMGAMPPMGPAVFGLPGGAPPGAPGGAPPQAGAGGPRPAPIQPPPAGAKKGGAPGAPAPAPEAAAAAAAPASAPAGAGAQPAAGAAAPRGGSGGEQEAPEAGGAPLPAIASLPGGVVPAVGW